MSLLALHPRDHGREAVELKIWNPSQTVKLTSSDSVRPEWPHGWGVNFGWSVAVDDGTAIVGRRDNYAYAFDATTGKLLRD